MCIDKKAWVRKGHFFLFEPIGQVEMNVQMSRLTSSCEKQVFKREVFINTSLFDNHYYTRYKIESRGTVPT